MDVPTDSPGQPILSVAIYSVLLIRLCSPSPVVVPYLAAEFIAFPSIKTFLCTLCRALRHQPGSRPDVCSCGRDPGQHVLLGNRATRLHGSRVYVVARSEDLCHSSRSQAAPGGVRCPRSQGIADCPAQKSTSTVRIQKNTVGTEKRVAQRTYQCLAAAIVDASTM